MIRFATNRSVYVAVVLAATFFLTGCLPSRRQPLCKDQLGSSVNAVAKLAVLSQHNRTLLAAKGLGYITVKRGDVRRRCRAAWVLQFPDKLRIQLMGIAGQPLLCFASDGEYYYFREEPGRKIVKKGATSTILDRLVGIPVHVSDLVCVLMGRLPLYASHRILNIEKDNFQRTILMVHDCKTGFADSLHLLGEGGVQQIERFDSKGEHVWQVAHDAFGLEQGYRLPMRTYWSASEAAEVLVEVERWWINPRVMADMFVIQGNP